MVTLHLFALLAVISSTALGADAPPADAAAAQAQCDKILAEYHAEESKLDETIKRTERAKWKGEVAEFHPVAARYAQELLSAARRYPHTPAAFHALIWVVSQLRIDAETRSQALDLLRTDYAASNGLRDVFTALFWTPMPGTEAFLRTVLEKNPDRLMQTWACFRLAGFLQGSERDKEAAEAYEHFIKEYGDVPTDPAYPNSTLRQNAEDALFVLRHLAVGQVAPEIDGADVDGKRFKLSDYRGKVVVVDFWGRW